MNSIFGQHGVENKGLWTTEEKNIEKNGPQPYFTFISAM